MVIRRPRRANHKRFECIRGSSLHPRFEILNEVNFYTGISPEPGLGKYPGKLEPARSGKLLSYNIGPIF